MIKMQRIRPAIAMIELIFAIVIIGIVLMSAPQLMQTAAKSGYVSIQQEGISEAASRVNMIMGYPWDEANVDDSTFNVLLQTTGGTANLNESNRTLANGFILSGYRVGTPMESIRNFVGPNPSNPRLQASSIGSEGGDMDDIDDFDSNLINLKDESSGLAGNIDYIEKTVDINISTTIQYLNDNTSAGGYNTSTITYNPDFTTAYNLTNIKGITVTLVSARTDVSELEKTIILRAFSCNIGGYKLEERGF